MVTGLEKVHFHSNPKEGQCQRVFKLLYNCSHFTCYQGNAQNPSVQASAVQELRTTGCSTSSRGMRDQITKIHWILEKARNSKKNLYFCFIDYAKAFDCVDHNKLWKILHEMGKPDHLIFLLRKLCKGQEATVRTDHGTMDWFQIGKGVCQGFILSPCLFNLFAE